ncbi:MAG: acetylornithine transaminase [Propionibacteriaceae bacterium]|nr:acetylornithine transaminase [Propionibacteriaceae bacterium]
MSLLTQYSASMMGTYPPPPVVFTKGQGVYLWDENGKPYLDLLAGIASVGLGHAHEGVAQAMADQARTLGHVSNLFATDTQVAYAEKLTGLLSNDAKVFFTNSGTESNEAAFKLTRLTGKTKIVAAQGCFHGRSMGSLALTWKPAIREPFEPLPGEVTWVPYGDANALAAAVDDHTAAIVLEAIQGEAGVVVPGDGYLAQARTIADNNGALLWLDEVQMGMGRTGTWFGFNHDGILPDIVTLAKALGNGFPMGAVLASGQAADLFTPGSHGTTIGGNPLACRVGLVVLDHVALLLDHVGSMGQWLMAALRTLDGVRSVRGRGLAIGIELEEPIAGALVTAGLNHGFIVNAPAPNLIRLVPPLILTQDEAGAFLDIWPTLIKEAHHG